MFAKLDGACEHLLRLIVMTLDAIAVRTAVVFAHASLNITSPTDGAVIEAAPSTFSLTFSEPVSPLALNLIRPDGASAALEGLELKDETVEIAAPDDLGRGTHVLTWCVVSADGHPVSG